MSRRQYDPIRFDDLRATEDDPIDLLNDLIIEINERFEVVYADATGRGASVSQTALTFTSTNLAAVPQLGAGVLFQLSAIKNATIPGFAGGYGGRVVVIQNTSIFSYTIAHESTTALPEERVTTRTGSSLTIAADGGLVLCYDDVISRWIPVCAQV